MSRLDARVNDYLKPYVEGGNFSGAVLIAQQGEVFVNHAYGQANYELNVPNTPATRFHIASVSKAFTATAVLLLELQGKLDTRDSISKWVPNLPKSNEITLHHLLTHTSGITNINSAPFYEDESKKTQTPHNLVQLIQTLPRVAAVGERYVYSNSNYNILAYIIESVSGASYGDFLKESVFEPLNLEDTGHNGNAQALIPNRAFGYVPIGLKDLGNAPWIDWSIKTGNGSLYATTADLLKFTQAFFNGQLLPNATVEMILNAGQGNVYGWFVGEAFGQKRMVANGRSPGFTASLEHYIDEQTTVIVLSNLYSTVSHAVASDLAALALHQPITPARKITPIPLAPDVLSGFEGSYVGDETFLFAGAILTVASHENYLMMVWSTGADSILVPVSDNEFLDRSFWAAVRFEKDSNGRFSLIWTYGGQAYTAVRIDE